MGWKEDIYNYAPHGIQTLMLNSYALFLNLERYGKKFERRFAEFEEHEKYSVAELQEFQRERLGLLIRHAYEHVPYYREVMQTRKLLPSDIKELSDISKLPILTREDIKRNQKKLKADNIPWHHIRHGHTSGTTGSPLEFLWDVSVCVVHHVADWRQKKWAGMQFGDPFASLQGRQITPVRKSTPPYWVKNYIHNQLFLSSFHLKEENIRHILHEIEHFKPRAIEGYPSSMYIIARILQKNNLYLEIPAVLTSSETLLPMQRELIEERFKCKIFDFYGMAERVVFGTECESHARKHLNMDYGIAEIIDNNNAVLPPEHFGTLVATGLWNFAMPLIRYRTGDSSSISYAKCTCGRTFPLLDQITTKSEDIIVLKDRRMVPSSILTHPFKPLTTIKESQIVQESLGKIKVYLVKGEGFENSHQEALICGLQERLGSDTDIELAFVNNIPKEKNGKFRWVISKVSLDEW